MPKNNETTTKFKVDISELKKGIQDAQRQIRLANAEFKAASSGMDDWSKSADGVSAKLKQLNTTVDAQKKVLNSLEAQYAEVVREQGATSKGAEELKIKIANQQAAINKTEKEISKYTQSLADLESGADSADADLNDLADSTEDAGKAAEKAEGGFTVLKGALANLAAEGIKKCAEALGELTKELITDSSNAYAQFAAQTGTATDAMGEYEDAIKNIYNNNFGESLQDVAEKMAKVKEVTGEIDASKLEDMTKKAMTLEDTFGMDMTETLRGVNSLMDHFGMTSEEAFDLISSGAQNGLNYTDELGDNVAEYAGKFAEAGFSSEEYFQLLKNGAEGGAYNLDKVNDAVNEVTTRLADGTIEDSLDMFSTDTQSVFEAWKNGEATQKDVMASIVKDIQNTTNEQDKMNLAALAFGTMAEDGGTQFIEALSPVGDTFDDVKGKAEELMNVKYDTPGAAIKGIGRTLKTDLLQPLVDKLMPHLNKLAKWVTDNLPKFIEKVKELANKAKDVITELEKWTPLIAGIGAAIATYFAVTKIAAFVGWIKSGAAAIKMMEIAQAALNVVMNLNPIGIIIGLIAGLVAAFVILWNKSEAFREFWQNLWEKIKEAARVVVEAVAEFFSGLWENIKAVWSVVSDWFQEIWDNISDAVSSLIESVVKFFTNGWDNIKKIWSVVKDWFSDIWQGIKDVFSVVATWFSDMFSRAWSGVKNIWNAATGFFSGIWNGIKNALSSVATWFSDKFKSAYEGVSNAFSGIVGFFSGIWESIKEIFNKVGEVVGNAITNTVASAVNGVLSTAVSIINGFISAINGAISVINAIPGVKISKLSKLSVPELAEGGVLKKGQIGLLEGNGAEAVVPLDQNKKWISKTAQDMSAALRKENVIAGNNNTANNYTFNQYNNSPKALSRLEIYRQTKNQLQFAKGV
jgi:phage-related minor tail protein